MRNARFVAFAFQFLDKSASNRSACAGHENHGVAPLSFACLDEVIVDKLQRIVNAWKAVFLNRSSHCGSSQ